MEEAEVDAFEETECLQELQKVIKEKETLIKKQFSEIEVLKQEVKVLKQERDSLLCEFNKLRFELEMSELKRLKDGRLEVQEVRATMYMLSTPQKPDRPPCGPGPPLKQLKSYSAENGASPPITPTGIQRSRQRSVSGNINSRKLPSRTNEEILKRSRVQAAYELSQDLLDKQVEMLERKYGGHVRASKAALTIQRAFRRHCMVKKFQYITSSAKSEKRLSRRFNAVDKEDDWTPNYRNLVHSGSTTTVSVGCDMAPAYEMVEHSDAEAMIKSNFAALYRELNETLDVSENGGGMVDGGGGRCSLYPTRSMSMREKRLPSPRSGDVMVEAFTNYYKTSPVDTKEHNGNTNSLPRSSSSAGNRMTMTPHIRVLNNVDASNFESDYSDKDMSLMEESTYYTPSSTMSPPVFVRSVGAGWSHAPVGNGGGKQGVRTASPRSIVHVSPHGNQLTSPIDEHYMTCFESSQDLISDEGFLNFVQEEHHLQLSRDTVLRRTMASSPMDASFIKVRNVPQHRGIAAMSAVHHQKVMMDASHRRNSAPPVDSRKKVPPEVPKRTSSITSRSTESRSICGSSKSSDGGSLKGELVRSPDGGSLSSVQSSGSESSLTGSSSDRATPSGKSVDMNAATVAEQHHQQHNKINSNADASPVWKRKSQVVPDLLHPGTILEDKRLSNISENSEDSLEGAGYSSSPPISEVMYASRSYQSPSLRVPPDVAPTYNKMSEVMRKRQYRVGLNLFNKKPEKGIKYLIQRGFLENLPQAVARFLISRKGLSKQMIGEYLGNLQNPFNMEVLDCFAGEMDLAGMQVDVALRKFQAYFRMPGEAQKIERLMEVFGQHYCECNHDIVSKLHSPDTIFILAFAIIMLNTDLHTPNLKPERRMKMDDFIKNLRGIDDGHDLDREMLVGIYDRIKVNEFRPGSDHVTQVMKVQQTIVGKKPNLALPHRRLVCYCRLYEVNDIHKKERQGLHQREVFLFNDLLVVTKIFNKKKTSVTYTFRQSFALVGMLVQLFEVPHYPHGIRLVQKVDGKIMITFNARNEHDRCKFMEDLRESIYEMDEMENIRIETELEKQKNARSRTSENRDSGVADMELPPMRDGRLSVECGLKRSALSNSLLDIHEQSGEKPQRRGSAGSLDSGMSISFQSSAASTVSRESSPQQGAKSSQSKQNSHHHHQSFLGGLFSKKNKATPKSGSKGNPADTTDV